MAASQALGDGTPVLYLDFEGSTGHHGFGSGE